MSRLRESEKAFARDLNRAADIIDGTLKLHTLTFDEREDLAENLRSHAETLEDDRL